MLFAGLLACASVSAQTDDPVIMIVNGELVRNSNIRITRITPRALSIRRISRSMWTSLLIIN